MTNNKEETIYEKEPITQPFWGFWLSLLFQTAVIIAVPAQSLYTQINGKKVILQTAPTDPYELLQGYAPNIRYDISNQDRLRNLPGWQDLPKQLGYQSEKSFIKPGTIFYVILAEPISPTLPGLPEAWKPVAVSLKPPVKLKSDSKASKEQSAERVILKGLAQKDSIQYGLETYKIPEAQQELLNKDLRVARKANPTKPQQPPSIVVEIKVDEGGNANARALWAQFGEVSPQEVRSYGF